VRENREHLALNVYVALCYCKLAGAPGAGAGREPPLNPLPSPPGQLLNVSTLEGDTLSGYRWYRGLSQVVHVPGLS